MKKWGKKSRNKVEERGIAMHLKVCIYVYKIVMENYFVIEKITKHSKKRGMVIGYAPKSLACPSGGGFSFPANVTSPASSKRHHHHHHHHPHPHHHQYRHRHHFFCINTNTKCSNFAPV